MSNDSILVHAKEQLGSHDYNRAILGGKHLAGTLVKKMIRELELPPFAGLAGLASISIDQSGKSMRDGIYLTTREYKYAVMRLADIRAYLEDMTTKTIENNDYYSAAMFKNARIQMRIVTMHLRATYFLKWPVTITEDAAKVTNEE